MPYVVSSGSKRKILDHKSGLVLVSIDEHEKNELSKRIEDEIEWMKNPDYKEMVKRLSVNY